MPEGLLAKAASALAPHAALQPLKRAQGARSHDAVWFLAGAALEFADGPVCGWPEDAVVSTSIEAELVQPNLQGRDVVTSEHVTGAVLKQSLAHAPPGLFEAAERLGPDHAVNQQASILLELQHSSTDGVVKLVAVRARK
jgi:hypothetical protein